MVFYSTVLLISSHSSNTSLQRATMHFPVYRGFPFRLNILLRILWKFMVCACHRRTLKLSANTNHKFLLNISLACLTLTMSSLKGPPYSPSTSILIPRLISSSSVLGFSGGSFCRHCFHQLNQSRMVSIQFECQSLNVHPSTFNLSSGSDLPIVNVGARQKIPWEFLHKVSSVNS